MLAGVYTHSHNKKQEPANASQREGEIDREHERDQKVAAQFVR